jgi:YegS/Rv2252/BmrU family lipid kinase
MSIVAIVNPASGRGTARTAWESVRAHLPDAQTRETQRPGHATQLAVEAIRGGARTIVAAGGDGTINEIVNAFFEGDRSISDDVRLAILPGQGTGADFQRMFRFPAAHDELAARIARGEPRLVDVLKVRYQASDGRSAFRYSINITSFGMGGAVAARVASFPKAFGGRLRFLLATLQTSVAFKGAPVRIRIDESTAVQLRVSNVAIANGRYHGGGMLACPRAAIDDGLIDVTVVPFMPLPELVWNLPRLYNGEIYGHPKVQFYRARRIEADSEQLVLLEVDGEPVGRLPVEISIVPQAIRLIP